MRTNKENLETVCCIVAALLFLSLVFLTEIIYHLALVMRTNKENLETVCCIVAATLFLSPAVWIVARELMGY
jgi:UPF0716 family protein affecting phage T7 exclusion